MFDWGDFWAAAAGATSQQTGVPKTCADLLSIQGQLVDVVSLHYPTRQFIQFQPAKDSSLDRKAGRHAAPWRYVIRALFRRLRKLTNW
jgi:hypothetical protein